MRLEITRKGMIEVRDPSGRLVSSNTVIEEAIEDLVADAEAHPEIETYRITYPSREVRVIPKVVVVPVPDEVLVQGSGIQFTQGQAGAFDLGAAIASAIPSGHVVTSITPNKALPSGVSTDLANVEIDYDGAGAAASVGAAQDPLDLVVLTQPNTAELDWQSRISGAGVVWYHDFRSVNEVNAFRWRGGYGGGNDPVGGGPANCNRITSDGVTGACLEVVHAAGSSHGAQWWRPLGPIVGGTTTGNGRGAGQDDPGAGILTPSTWTPTDGGSQLSNWPTNKGVYGHPNYSNLDGNEFYFQIRVKMDPRRITGGNAANTVGKFVWFTIASTASSLTNQEHVTYSYGNGGNDGAKNYHRVYVGSLTGVGDFGPLDQAVSPYDGIQPGSEIATDWSYSGGWDTLLYHFKPGVAGVSSGANASLFECWAAHPGETSYTKIWSVPQYGIASYNVVNGLQALILGVYNNNNTFPQTFWHRYCQLIFSRSFIQCPQA